MSAPERSSDLAATPQLARRLAALRARLYVQIWMHGLGTLALVIGVWLAFVFFADWALHVPLGVRWFHLLVFVALPVVLVRRELVRHLRRMPDAVGLALLVEREHPRLREILVSAVELQQRRDPGARLELVERVLRDAEIEAARLDLRGVLDERPQRWRVAGGFAAALLVVIGVARAPELAGVFFSRLFGGDTPWPQRTELVLALPPGLEHARVAQVEGGIEARIARGTDLPVVVHARGEVPEEVVLHFGGGSEAVLGAGADGTFRTLLRSCRENLTLYASGGDDEATDKLFVVVLDPPDVAALAVRIEPPAYSGLAPRVEFDRDVQVLAGSKLSVAILVRPPEATGIVRLLPADATIALEPRPFPARENGASEASGLGFETIAAQSLRYRFELRDGSGLTDPDPGLFSVEVLADDRPQIDLIAPGRLDVETIAGGALRLSLRVVDDFGVASAEWRSRSVGQEETSSDWKTFELRAAPMPMRGDEASRGTAVVGSTRVDVASLAPAGATPAEGDLYELDFRAIDTRPPLADGAPDPAGVASSAPVRLRLVSDDEFLRRLQDRMSKIRQQAAELDELLRRQMVRTRDALAALERDESAGSASELSSLQVGERRVTNDGEGLTREIAGAVETLLYSRIEEKSGALLEALDAELASAAGKGFPADSWRSFAEGVRSGRLLAQGLAGQLTGVFDLAFRVSADELPAATEALDRAARRTDVADVHAELTTAAQREETAQKHLAELLDRLAEWDNFQSILSLTRDILNRQKSVRDKTLNMSGTRK